MTMFSVLGCPLPGVAAGVLSVLVKHSQVLSLKCSVSRFPVTNYPFNWIQQHPPAPQKRLEYAGVIVLIVGDTASIWNLKSRVNVNMDISSSHFFKNLNYQPCLTVPEKWEGDFSVNSDTPPCRGAQSQQRYLKTAEASQN